MITDNAFDRGQQLGELVLAVDGLVGEGGRVSGSRMV